MRFKFGVQIPKNTAHALHLDEVENNSLWKESIDKELNYINSFETFKVLEDDELISASAVPAYRGIIQDENIEETDEEQKDKFNEAEKRLREELAAFKLNK